jgi:NADPH-dependent glutamate synthase beta subunit-like oxidoreductase
MGELNGKYQVKILGLEDYQALVACQSACPLGTDTKRYVKAITEGDYEQAYLVARQSNPLVSVCSRVCTAPCEKSCRKGGEGSPVDIRALKRFVCDQHGVASPHAVAKRLDEFSQRDEKGGDRTGNHIVTMSRLFRKAKAEKDGAHKNSARVAIVGSGPTGLSAAHDLAVLGYRVTIFEAAPLPGGQLRTGIPGFRLPKEIVQQEIDAILELGVELKLNSPIGAGLSLADLREQGYQTVFITIGLQDPMKIDIEGTGLKGVYNGIDYVRDHAKIELGKSCLVIGGGGVAMDCAQHAVRRGAERVMIACLESWETMPASLSDKEDAQEEGIVFHPSLGPQRIVGKEGRVTGIEFLKVSSVFDAEGKFNPSFVAGSRTVLEADTVILAIGQSSTMPLLTGMDGLEMTPNGLIRANEDMSTNLPGVYAGGDVRWRFARNATDAIADGQRAARAIHGYLRGKTLSLRKKGYMRAVAPDFHNTRCETIAPVKIPKRNAGERIRNQQEITLGFEEAQARQQAARCRQCNVQTVFDRSRCLLCGTCADTCVEGALKLVRLADIQGDGKLELLTGALEKLAPGTRGRTAIIKDDSRCVSCGICASRCPGGAITMAEFNIQEEWE